MSKCSACGKTILFGGKKADEFVFCSDKCRARGQLLVIAKQVPKDMVSTHARAIFSGACPVCKQQRGPVDVHVAHKIASFLVMTSWSSKPGVSCRTCGLKSQVGATAYSLLLGWWGFPWGLIMTPVQVVKNMAAILHNEQHLSPSPELERLVRLQIAANAAETARKNGQ